MEVGAYEGSVKDAEDGFIHFSAAHQAVETAAKHFAGQDDLVLLEISAATLGPALKWEPSRGGDLFPHLYGALQISQVDSVSDLLLGADGHKFPALKD